MTKNFSDKHSLSNQSLSTLSDDQSAVVFDGRVHYSPKGEEFLANYNSKGDLIYSARLSASLITIVSETPQ